MTDGNQSQSVTIFHVMSLGGQRSLRFGENEDLARPIVYAPRMLCRPNAGQELTRISQNQPTQSILGPTGTNSLPSLPRQNLTPPYQGEIFKFPTLARNAARIPRSTRIAGDDRDAAEVAADQGIEDGHQHHLRTVRSGRLGCKIRRRQDMPREAANALLVRLPASEGTKPSAANPNESAPFE